MVFFAALFAVMAGSTMSSSVVGLSISYALNVSNKYSFILIPNYNCFTLNLTDVTEPILFLLLYAFL